MRNEELVRYWAIPGTEGFEHRVGGLEKDYETGVLSNNPENHARMWLPALKGWLTWPTTFLCSK